MDAGTVVALVCGLVLGLALGALGGLLLTRVRREAELAEVREETARVRADVAEIRVAAAVELADARAEAAAAQAEAATVAAALAGAQAERDAAVSRAQEIAGDREAMLNQFKVLSADTLDRHSRAADAQAEHRLKATEQLMVPVRESLDRFGARLTEVEKERTAISTELRTQVATVRQTGETLRRETAALVAALRKPQVRGSWGETQLRRVAEIAGMLDRCDFDLQLSSRDDDRLLRPDMRVNLAEGKHLFVDAKAPLTAFLEAAETDDGQIQAEALTRYARHVRTHIDQLSSKQYWRAAESPEFVVLFLPNEMFFSAALDQMPDLYDYAAARDVVLATPTTLIGLLRAVAYGWKQAALAESAAEVFRLGRDLHAKLGLMGNRLDKLGRALRSSVNAYNETIATVEGTVLVRARRFRDLKVSDAELTALPQLDDAVRQIQAQELVDDAVQVEPMVGRGRKKRSAKTAEVPEAAELVRSEPDLLELVEGDVLPSADEEAGRRSS
ncbi:MAG TPA: DNA recombination protein RmuC [Propionibacteriaceae bacterium]|jgi:DNA recombination protein RmuC|nr:DNA recombination protein RmuC [Propionibacteriaceae bacterium]